MTNKPKTEDKDTKAKEAAEAKRISPDKPLGEVTHEETDFYQRQREASPDGMTAAERDQAQKSAPGALNQTDPAGEKVGDPDQEQPKATPQSKGI